MSQTQVVSLPHRLRRRAPLLAALVAALLYPFALKLLHAANVAIAAGDRRAWVIAVLALLAALAVPVAGFGAASRQFLQPARTHVQLRLRRLSLLPMAAPPAFTCLGVLLYMAGGSWLEPWAWGAGWLGLLWLALRPGDERVLPEADPGERLRVAHGVVAVLLLLFILPHLANHLVALAGAEPHKTLMRGLRIAYRHRLVESALVVLFVLQGALGLGLLLRRSRQSGGALAALQLGSGLFLLVFLSSHLVGIFFLGRMQMALDTNFDFAAGLPAGLLRDPWNVRLVPHYGLSVFVLCAHLGCAMLAIARARGWPAVRGRRLLGGMLVLGGVVSVLLQLPLNGVFPLAMHRGAATVDCTRAAEGDRFLHEWLRRRPG